MHGEVFTAVFFTEALAALGQFVAQPSAVGNILENGRKLVCAAECQTVVPQPLFIGFHGPGDGVGGGNGVHTQFVQKIVPVQNLLQIVVADIAAKKAKGFQFGTFDFLALDGNSPGAADGAGEAALVGNVKFLSQPLAADLLKIFILTGGIISGRQQPPHLHGADQSSSAYLGQLISGEGMVLQVGKPLFAPLRGLFLIVNRNGFVSGDGNGF